VIVQWMSRHVHHPLHDDPRTPHIHDEERADSLPGLSFAGSTKR
jgi:hypothetical protein